MADPERYTGGAEHGTEVREAAERQSEKLGQQLEKGAEQLADGEARTSAERKNVEAAFEKERPANEHKNAHEPSGPAITHQTSKKQKEAAYNETMGHIRAEMSPT
ncbi:MAG TPA: hypothetical protein VH144_03735, partial [Candidatus Saccharimonadales bacterium]|nr:hypothetical protein [Candidatus Saccharimonadales bacterium]